MPDAATSYVCAMCGATYESERTRFGAPVASGCPNDYHGLHRPERPAANRPELPQETAERQDVAQDREPGEVDLSSFHDCPLCDKLFFSFMDLYDHIARHRKEPKA